MFTSNKKVIATVVAVVVGASAAIVTAITGENFKFSGKEVAQQTPVTQKGQGDGVVQIGGNNTGSPLTLDLKKTTHNEGDKTENHFPNAKVGQVFQKPKTTCASGSENCSGVRMNIN